MQPSMPAALIAASLLVALSSSMIGAPLQPRDSHVADTPHTSGGDGFASGLSVHPHFRVMHDTTGAPRPAVKLRVQVALDPEFAETFWDSGFTAISATPSGHWTDAVAYTGPALSLGTEYFWRAAVMDDQNVAGPFSELRQFAVAAPHMAVDVRVSTGIGSQELQGNPVVVTQLPPSFSAEHAGGPDTMQFARVQVSRTSDFETVIWTSGSLPTGQLVAGQRTPPLSYGGPQLSPGRTYFVRVALAPTADEEAPWSTYTTSFVHIQADPAAPSPGGFSRNAVGFGVSELNATDLALVDINGNGVTDAVLATGSVDLPHVIYLDPGICTQTPPILFGASRGGSPRVLVADFNFDGALEVVIVDDLGLQFYHMGPGGVPTLESEVTPDVAGPLLAIQTMDINWDGWPDVLATHELGIAVFAGTPEGFSFQGSWGGYGSAIQNALVTDFNPKDELVEVWVAVGDNLYLHRGEPGFGEQVWQIPGLSTIALGDFTNPFDPVLLLGCVDRISRFAITLGDGGVGMVELIAAGEIVHGINSPCLELIGREVTGDQYPDAIALYAGTAAVWRFTGTSLEVHEYLGHPGGVAESTLRVADMNADNFPDVVLLRSEASHVIHLNKPRIGVSIAGGTATQTTFGESFVEFELTLNAVPISMVAVDVATFELEGDGGEGDGDALPDVDEYARAQAPTLPYVPTTRRVFFLPGQTVALFRVPLTKQFHATQWQLGAQILTVTGAYAVQGTAVGTVFAHPVGAGSSGPPATPGMHRDFDINGEVRAIATAGGITYLGGDFDSVSWNAQGAAAMQPNGDRKLKLPAISSGSVYTVEVHPDGSYYIGGNFTIATTTTLIKNIAKCHPNGDLDTYFAPNPDGRVNSIAFDAYDRVYFGGKFTGLGIAPAVPFHNIAWVSTAGTVVQGFGGSNAYGMKNSATSNGEVLVVKVAHSGVSGHYLLAGGQYLNQAVRTDGATAQVTALSFASYTGNFAGFQLGGTHLLTKPAFTGPVRDIEVDSSTLIGTQYSSAILIGGSYLLAGLSQYVGVGPNLVLTNFAGQYFNIGGSPSPVHAIERDSTGRFWIGRDSIIPGTSTYVDPLAAYAWVAGSGLTQQSIAASGITVGSVRDLSAGNDEMLVVGSFTVMQAGQPAAHDMAVYSAVAGQLGQRSAAFKATTNATSPLWAAATVRHSGSATGYVICGSFTKLIAPRGNLAALDDTGQLLTWGPHTNAPVNTLVASGTHVYAGGSFTTVGGQARAGVAAIAADSIATTPAGWVANVSGSQQTVHALALTANHLIVGGDFMSINGVGYNDIAAVELAGAGVVATGWNVDLQDGAGDGVYALHIDSSSLYIGGRFTGASAVTRPGILAVDLPGSGTGTLSAWDAGLTWPCTVKSIGTTIDDVVFVGDFQSVQSHPRSGAAGVEKAAPHTPTMFQPVPTGEFNTVRVSSGGLIYLGGNFDSVKKDQAGGSPLLTRRGVVVLDDAGNILSWSADVLATSGESVYAMHLEDIPGSSRLWVGGNFDGLAAGQQNLTWFSAAFYITTSTLPAVHSGLAYPAGVTVQNSSNHPCTWTISSIAAPNITIDANGLLGGTGPVIAPGQPMIAPVLITADAGGGQVASRWFMITVIPPPPPTLVSITGPATVVEGDHPVKTPGPEWTVSLNQAFSVPVTVALEYIDLGARKGHEYAPQVFTVVFYPQGTPVPSNLPPRTLATNGFSIQVPLTVFGNTTPDLTTRDFRIEVSSLTPNVSAHPSQDSVHVTILNDDPLTPVARAAFVIHARVLENASALADPQGVVSDMPLIEWVFGTDLPGETQGWWQVQVASDQAFSNLIFPGGQAAGDDAIMQLPVVIPDGADCYVRVRVWPASDGSATGASDWYTFTFHRNQAPLPAHHLAPVGVVPKATPTLTWEISDDPDGDRQHALVRFWRTSNPSQVYVLDSRAEAALFEYETGASWRTLSHGGAPAGTTKMRVTIPASMALDPVPVVWDWCVDMADPFEVTAATSVANIFVDPSYLIEGTYVDQLGSPLAGRQLRAVLLPGHTPLHGANVVTGIDGSFTILVPLALNVGDTIAIFADPTALDPNGAPFNEYAGAMIRFSGSDLVALAGPHARVQVVRGTCLLDAREQGDFSLADLVPPAAPATPVSGFAFVDTPVGLEFITQFERLELRSMLRVRGAYAATGEPTCLLAPVQSFAVAVGGALSIQQGGEAQLGELVNAGQLIVHAGGYLRLTQDSSSTGVFWLKEGGSILLAQSTLTMDGGEVLLQAGNMTGLAGTESVKNEAAALTVQATTFTNCMLEIGPQSPEPAVSGMICTPGSNDRYIAWRRVSDVPVVFSGIRFDVGATYNVYAEAGCGPLIMRGCGGDLAGEANDFDPGEGTGADLVTWEAAAVTGLAAHAGDERILIIWSPDPQAGANTQFEVHVSSQPTGPFTAAGTTSDHYFVHQQLTNDATYYYIVRTVGAGLQPADSEQVSCVPRDAVLTSTAPLAITGTGVYPAILAGAHTSFNDTTVVTCAAAGVTIPLSSVAPLGNTLLLFTIETSGAPTGSITVEVTTQDIWEHFGVYGYSEQFSIIIEVEPPASPAIPTIEFVEDAGAVAEGDVTDGAFTVSVEFNDHSGAPVEPLSFQCIVDRDIIVGGNLVIAGTDLAGPGLNLWGTPTTAGASWDVDQVYTSTDPYEEYISPGELVISVRICNKFGLQSPWHERRIFVNDQSAAVAFVSAYLKQGTANQVVNVVGNDLTGATDVEFDDSEITVNSVTVHQTGGSNTQATTWLEANLTVSDYARIGTGQVTVKNSQAASIAVGSYRTVPDLTTSNTIDAYPDPLAAKGGINVTLQNGSFSWSATDLTTDGRAFPIVWDRTYRSDKHWRKTALGYGWINRYLTYIDVTYDGKMYTDFTWNAPDGGEYRFVRYDESPVEEPNYGVYYTTPIGLAAKASVIRALSLPTAQHPGTYETPNEIAIQTTDGLVYVYDVASQDVLLPTLVRWRLKAIEDAYRNTHSLIYDSEGRLTRIEGDGVPMAVTTGDRLQSTQRVGDSLEFNYNYMGLLSEVRRVWRHAQVVHEQDGVRYWSVVTQSAALEKVTYHYNQNTEMVLQRLPDGGRHGTLYNGYRYDQIGGGPRLLTGIYSPSRVVNPAPAVPTSTHYGTTFVHSEPATLAIAYQESWAWHGPEYRVVQQLQLEDIQNTTPSYRTWTLSYSTYAWPHKGAFEAVLTRPDSTTTTYSLTPHGQASEITVSNGGLTYATQYAYHVSTRATIQVIRPRGNSTYFMYAHDPEPAVSGTFNGVSLAGNYSHLACGGMPGWADLELWRGQLVRLRKAGSDFYRYAIVENASDDTDLVVFGDLAAEGWGIGEFTIFNPNSNPLSRYKVIQKRECRTDTPGLDDLVTTYTHVDGSFLGRYQAQVSSTIDPRGNLTTVTYHQPGEYQSEKHRTGTNIVSSASYKMVLEGTVSTVVSHKVTTTDAFGRTTSERIIGTWDPVDVPDEATFALGGVAETTYEYYDSSVTLGAAWRLKSITLSSPSGDGPVSVTSMKYDTKGNLSETLPPNATGTALDRYKTIYHFNDARQVYRVQQPYSKMTSTEEGPDVLTYYDKDGRVTRQVSKLTSSLGSSSAIPPTGNPQTFDDNQVESSFARPTSHTGAGWLHTSYVYNLAGELLQQSGDVDLSVSATASKTYDKMGRVLTETDPEGRSISYTYELRGLMQTMTVGSGAETAHTGYLYDPNSNLVEVIQSDGSRISHEYDPFDRLIKTTSPASQGKLVHEVVYPGNSGPDITKEKWTQEGGTGLVRESWSERDALGRVFRTMELARSSSGQKLGDAAYLNGKPWRVTTSQLDHRGLARSTWVTLSDGHSTSSSTDPGAGGKLAVLGRSEPNAYGWVKTEMSNDATTKHTYTAAGQVAETRSPYYDGGSTRELIEKFQYDPAGNLWKVTDGLGKDSTIQRNNLGWAEKSTDAAGRISETEFNFVGQPRRTTVTDNSSSGSIVTETTYDKTGLVLTETAYRGTEAQVTGYSYDSQGRLRTISRPDTGIYTYTYDVMGRVVTETLPDGMVITNTYDAAGNLTRTSANGGSGVTPIGGGEVSEFTYNAFGEVLTADTFQGGTKRTALTMSYNTLGMIDEQILEVLDAQGQLVSVEVPSHTHAAAQLGFKSQYDTAPRQFSQWRMTAKHDVLGRELELEYWDGRKLKTTYTVGSKVTNLSAIKVHDSGVDVASETPILTYKYILGMLAERKSGAEGHTSRIRVPAGRPTEPGKNILGQEPPRWVTTIISQDKRGLLSGVRHHDGGVNKKILAGTQVRHDYSGNPVLERRLHQGGLSRVMKYDFAGRMSLAARGHMIGLNAAMPSEDIPTDAPQYLDPASTSLSHQWRRSYDQDSVDNILGTHDTLRSGQDEAQVWDMTQNLVSAGSVQKNLIGDRSDATGDFSYDLMARIKSDPTREVTYEHNYRGQVTRMNTSGVAREMVYDAFGRMVLQVDVPGEIERRSTILVPNLGMGGGGQGADFAGEVTYARAGSLNIASEVLQYSYGLGAIGGGIGRKRLVEFVAYAGEFAPYFRFLQEDTMGNTIATTSLFADKLDEYDYTDYGVPLHAPVALDGRWIQSIEPHTTYSNVSVVTLTHDILEPNELLGCELRLTNPNPTGPHDTYRTATVISHKGIKVHLHDDYHAVKSLWWATSHLSGNFRTANFFDLRAGVYAGVVDSAETSPAYTENNWPGEPCFKIVVDNEPFMSWMYTWYDSECNDSIPDRRLKIRMYEPNVKWHEFEVLGPTDLDPNGGFKKLAIRGTKPAWLGAGVWYGIDGGLRHMHTTQSGTWANDAISSTGDYTQFKLDSYAAVTREMVGWMLQPDINYAVYVPITEVDPANNTITASGNYAGNGGTIPNLGKLRTRFRIYAPPGVQRHGLEAGTLSDYVAGESSRYLFAGYRYESPLAGFDHWEATLGHVTRSNVGRQTGLNFAGLHYTLHRHYDPVLMRFTGPDPLASPFYNLHHYTGNSPARYFDPDGLFELELFSIGDTKIGISTEGYGRRFTEGLHSGAEMLHLKEIAVGGIVGAWDAVTFGLHLDDEDRRGIAMSYGVDPQSGYFAAGMVFGNIAVSVALGAVSGGLSGATCITRAASVARVVGNLMKGAMIAGEAVEIGGAALEYAETGEWSMRQTMALVGLAGNVGGHALGKFFAPKCFVEGTEVAVEGDGGLVGKPIEEIEVGDLVWARCDFTGEEGFKPVVTLFRNEADTLVDLTYTTASGSGTLTGTEEHPFWSATRETWVAMAALAAGEQLLLSGGQTALVASVRVTPLQTPVTVYNFEVADWHTYFVSGDADSFVLVHNRCGGTGRAAPDGGRGVKSSGKGRPTWHNDPDTGAARGHSRKHGPSTGVGANKRAYVEQAMENINFGREFKVNYKGDIRNAYVSRLGGDRFLYTSTSLDRRVIYTSHLKSARDLAKFDIDVSKIK